MTVWHIVRDAGMQCRHEICIADSAEARVIRSNRIFSIAILVGLPTAADDILCDLSPSCISTTTAASSSVGQSQRLRSTGSHASCSFTTQIRQQNLHCSLIHTPVPLDSSPSVRPFLAPNRSILHSSLCVSRFPSRVDIVLLEIVTCFHDRLEETEMRTVCFGEAQLWQEDHGC